MQEVDFLTIFNNLPWNIKLQVLRTMKQWKQKEAAEKCGTVRRIYSNWETGKFKPLERNQKIITKVFGVNVFEEIHE